MKNLILTFFLFSIYQIANSQNYDSVFYNSKWEVTSFKYGKYFRISRFDSQKMTFDSLVTDHFYDGSIEMTGKYLNGLKEGEFIYYYPNRSIRLRSEYSKNNRVGTWTEFFENGQIFKEVCYDDNKEKLTKYFDKRGKSILKKETGKYSFIYYLNPQFSSYSTEIYDDNSIKYILKGKLENGLKNGKWTVMEYRKFFYEKSNKSITKEIPEIFCELNYRNGLFIKGTYHFQDGLKQNILTDVFTYLMLEPEKIIITEAFHLEPGQLIKENNLLRAMQNANKYSDKQINLKDTTDIIEYFDAGFTLYVKDCSDTFSFNLSLKINESNIVEIDSITPKLSPSFEKEVNKIIHAMPKIDNCPTKNFNFDYRVLCVDELDYKK
ncbi:MAG: hypothetical protein PHV20_10730 [Bacteroidales bacterium]|nr:hypothetical protein [Bacteroidales bacterium]